MSEELQKEIDRLKSENAKLARDLVGAQEDLKEVRGEARDRRHESKTLKEQVEALVKERDTLKAKAEADPEDLKSKLAETEGKLRDVHHRAAFAKVAQGLKVSDPTKVADLYALSGYTPEDDQADDAKLAEVIQGALKARPHFLDTTPAGAGTNAPGGANGAANGQLGGKPGVGSDRGQSVTSESKSTPAGKVPGRL